MPLVLEMVVKVFALMYNIIHLPFVILGYVK